MKGKIRCRHASKCLKGKVISQTKACNFFGEFSPQAARKESQHVTHGEKVPNRHILTKEILKSQYPSWSAGYKNMVCSLS
jgi:hypothetical protein